jgi:hypothetical protein
MFSDGRRRAGAGLLGITIKSTRAWTYGRDQLKICWKRQRSFGAADGHDFIFHWLTHHFQDARAEFGEFI